MGKQIEFHMLREDTGMFLDFVREHDPVVVITRDSDSPIIEVIPDPTLETRTLALWNQALLSVLTRKHYVHPAIEYYHVDDSLPVLEFSPSESCEWNGKQGLRKGRIYGTFDSPSKEYERWYNALVRWIRKNYISNPVDLGGYVGPAAYKWFQSGGVLLPSFQPPLTQQWLSFAKKQDSIRKSLSSSM